MLESMCTDWTAFAPDQRMLQLVEELFDWVNQPQFDLKGSVAELKGWIGEGPNHSNFSDESSVNIVSGQEILSMKPEEK